MFLKVCKVTRTTDAYINAVTCNKTLEDKCNGEWDSQDCIASLGTAIGVCRVEKDTTTRTDVVTCNTMVQSECDDKLGEWGLQSCTTNPGTKRLKAVPEAICKVIRDTASHANVVTCNTMVQSECSKSKRKGNWNPQICNPDIGTPISKTCKIIKDSDTHTDVVTCQTTTKADCPSPSVWDPKTCIPSIGNTCKITENTDSHTGVVTCKKTTKDDCQGEGRAWGLLACTESIGTPITKTCKVEKDTDSHTGVVTCDKTTKTQCDTDKGTWDPPSCEPSDGTKRQTPVEEKVCKITKDTDTHTGVVTCDKNIKTECDTKQGEWDPQTCTPFTGQPKTKICKITTETYTHTGVVTCDTTTKAQCDTDNGDWDSQSCTTNPGTPKTKVCKITENTPTRRGVVTCDTATKTQCDTDKGEWGLKSCTPSKGKAIKVCKITTETPSHTGVVTCEKTTKTKCDTKHGEWDSTNCTPSAGTPIPNGTPIPPGVVFVKAGTRTTKNGKSWNTAYSDLQKGIEEASEKFKSTKKPVKVYVAQGTYKPQSRPNGGTSDRHNHFSLRNGVEVIGGFPGLITGESNNPNYYKTVLSGDIRRVGDDSDNAYHVFYHPATAKLDNTAKLVGVIITKGNTNTSSNSHSSGGGMFNYESSPTLTNVEFNSNTASYGGGMDNTSSSSPTLTNVEFNSNTASYGGGMFNFNNSSPTLKDVTFTSNTATYRGGGMYNYNESSPTLTNVTFTSNTANRYGGGMVNWGNSKPTLDNTVIFNKNIAGSVANSQIGKGGAIYNYSSSITGTPTYGTGTNENKKVVKNNNGTYKLIKSNLDSD